MIHKYRKWWFIVVVLFLAIFIRIYNLESMTIFSADQARDAIVTLKLLRGKYFPLWGSPTSEGGIYMGAILYYIGAPFLALFQLNPVGLSIAVISVHIISILCAYIFLKKYLDVVVGGYFIVLVMLSKTQVFYSRFFWSPNFLLPLSFFSLLLTLFLIIRVHRLYSLGVGVFLSITTLLHPFGYALFFIYELIILSLWLVTDNIGRKISVPLLVLCGYILPYIPQIIFAGKTLQQNFQKSSMLVAHGSATVVHNDSQLSFTIMQNITVFMNFLMGISYWWTSIVFLVCILTGFYFIFKRGKSPYIYLYSLCISYVVLYIILFSATHRYPHGHYFASIYWGAYLIIAMVLAELHRLHRVGKYLSIGLLLIFCFFNVKYIISQYAHPRNELPIAKEVTTYIHTQVKGQPFSFITTSRSHSNYNFLYFLHVFNDASHIDRTDRTLPLIIVSDVQDKVFNAELEKVSSEKKHIHSLNVFVIRNPLQKGQFDMIKKNKDIQQYPGINPLY